MNKSESKFETGRLVTTAGVYKFMSESAPFLIFVNECLGRHGAGDWGDVDSEDRARNDRALRNGTRLMSVYAVPAGIKGPDPMLWIVTEADRSVTTALWPSEY